MSSANTPPKDELVPRTPCPRETSPHASTPDQHRIPASGGPMEAATDGRCWPAGQPGCQQIDSTVTTSRTRSDAPFRDSSSKVVKRVSLVETVMEDAIGTRLVFEMHLHIGEVRATADGNIIRFHEETICTLEEATRFFVAVTFSVKLGNDKIDALGHKPPAENWNAAISSQYDAFVRLRGGNPIGPNISHYRAQNDVSDMPSWFPNYDEMD